MWTPTRPNLTSLQSMSSRMSSDRRCSSSYHLSSLPRKSLRDGHMLQWVTEWSAVSTLQAWVSALPYRQCMSCLESADEPWLTSFSFHTLLCHRERRVADWGMQLDFQGVLLLMWGATVPLIYYGFICDPKLRWVYWSIQTGLAVAASAFTLQPNFKDPALKMLRALTFGGFALSSLVPVVHAVVKYGWGVQAQRMGLIWVFATLAFNTTGATAYALKFPEAVWPRRFDLFGCSHNILHIAVICAGLTHMVGILQAFDFLHGQGDTCA